MTKSWPKCHKMCNFYMFYESLHFFTNFVTFREYSTLFVAKWVIFNKKYKKVMFFDKKFDQKWHFGKIGKNVQNVHIWWHFGNSPDTHFDRNSHFVAVRIAAPHWRFKGGKTVVQKVCKLGGSGVSPKCHQNVTKCHKMVKNVTFYTFFSCYTKVDHFWALLEHIAPARV